MIKQINVSNIEKLQTQLHKAKAEGYTHVAPYSNEIMIHQPMLNAVELQGSSIVVDYTIDNIYLNDCRYFGLSTIEFEDWATNINYYPNIIFNITEALGHFEQYHIETLFDLAIVTLLQGDVIVDGHVVFDFKAPFTTSEEFWRSIKQRDNNAEQQFFLNKIAYEHQRSIPYPKFSYNNHEDLRYADSLLLSTKFKLPRWLYNSIKNRNLRKHKSQSGYYTKNDKQLKNHIVFLGDHYRYDGNSKYLFNYFVKHNATIESYFITNDRKGPHFISPKDDNTKSLIEQAKIVILENDLPETLEPNGKLIQLHQGTPIQKLFLDSPNPTKNLNDYNYRAKRYNRWLQHDYIIHSADSSRFYETAFPSHDANVLAYGNPKIQYLLQRANNEALQAQLKQSLQLNNDKPILLYAPISSVTMSQLPLSDAIFKAFQVVVKGLDHHAQLPEEAIVAPSHLSTQDLVILSDVVLTDYSTIVFDALAIDKKVCLYTPNHSEFMQEQGIDNDIWSQLSKIWYTERQLLISNLISDAIPTLNYQTIHHKEQPLETISQLINKLYRDIET